MLACSNAIAGQAFAERGQHCGVQPQLGSILYSLTQLPAEKSFAI